MQIKKYKELTNEFIDLLSNYFKDKIDDFAITDHMDEPYTQFRMEFTVYKYYIVVLGYEHGIFGCSILNGKYCIHLDNSQEWYDRADLNIFVKELDEQLRLRIPDKFLKYYGWK